MSISKTWDVNPKLFVSFVESDIAKSTGNLARKIFNGVVSRTPVYTGSLRASWMVSESPTGLNVSGGSPSSVLPPPTFPSSLLMGKPRTLYITNTTPYAGLVEFGGPKNIPRAMVQNTLNSL